MLDHLPVLPAWLPLAVAVATLLVYSLYRMALPHPFPGIPYNKNLGILGDMPEILAVRKQAKGFRWWFGELSARHNSPLTQIFVGPFSPSILVLNDYREAMDISLRRTKEFDRDKRQSVQAFENVVPEHHISMESGDPRFKRNRELVRDLMTPAFLEQVSAPSIYAQAMQLIRLWELRQKVAGGRPFAAAADIQEAAMDIILAVAFGFNERLNLVRRLLAEVKASSALTSDLDKPVEFIRPEQPQEIRGMLTVVESLLVSFTSPLPRLHHWFLRHTKWRKAFALKDMVVHNEIDKAVARVTKAEGSETAAHSAVDHMVQREMASAAKAGRKPDFHTNHMRDEIFGYVVAGHDTSGTTLMWLVKYLADNPHAQTTLRAHQRAVFPAAARERRAPTVAEITKTRAPYLDAVLEESLRLAPTIPLTMREAVVDTTVLGHAVPKGTAVFLFHAGPSYLRPGIAVPEGVRSESSRAARGRVGSWDEEGMGDFVPERWLRRKEGGAGAGSGVEGGREGSGEGEREREREREARLDDVEFDAQAGPFLTFGSGPRGCFGRRLAYLEMRIVTSLLVWHFEFEKCTEAQSLYDGFDVMTTMPRQCFVRLQKV